MICKLIITNLALIEKLEIPFYRGLHVLSGETGAGKSIVVDAVMAVLGNRTDHSLIRTGSDKASVEAVFDLSDVDWVNGYLIDNGIETDSSEISIYREINSKGGGQCRIGGVPVTLTKLKEFSSMLVDIHGQDQHRFLMDNEMQKAYLDALGSDNHQKLRQKVAEACTEFVACHREYARLKRLNDTRDIVMDDVRNKLKLLKSVDLDNESEEILRIKLSKIRDSEKVISTMDAARNCLLSSDNEEGLLAVIKKLLVYINELKSKNDKFSEYYSSVESAYYIFDELAYYLSKMIDESSSEQNLKEQIEDKLDLFIKIRKIFGDNYEHINKTRSVLENEYDELTSLEDRIASVSAEHKRLLSIYRSLARELTESRKAIADKFSDNMIKELSEVGMEKTQFTVNFIQKTDAKPSMPTLSGDDLIEFMISPNPGEPLKPMTQIASGGELSRIMLAVKSLESEHSGVMTMIFDEIDTGISGRIAQAVAEKMKKIADIRQVICVTHLPQIAAQADHQYLVDKSTKAGRTTTSVSELDMEGRIYDIARLISGSGGVSKESIDYASKLIYMNNSTKRDI